MIKLLRIFLKCLTLNDVVLIWLGFPLIFRNKI